MAAVLARGVGYYRSVTVEDLDVDIGDGVCSITDEHTLDHYYERNRGPENLFSSMARARTMRENRVLPPILCFRKVFVLE